MSAPTSATGDGSPSPGFYPDPSIPGYVRYWNGGSWVPGTSRPAPGAGEDLPEEPHGGPAAPAVPAARRTPAPSVEETGPMFFDEDDPAGTPRQEPASVWQADTRRQTGFGGDRDARVSWGESGRNTPAAPDPDEAARDPRYDSRLPGRTAEPAADPTGGALPGVRSAARSPGRTPMTTTHLPARARSPSASRAPDAAARTGPARAASPPTAPSPSARRAAPGANRPPAAPDRPTAPWPCAPCAAPPPGARPSRRPPRRPRRRR